MGKSLSCCQTGPVTEQEIIDYAKQSDSPAALLYSKTYTKSLPNVRDIYTKYLQNGPDSISVIDLKDLKFSEIDSDLVAKLLQELTNLTELILVNNELGHYGINQITDSTSNLTRLEKLILNNNQINDSAMELLCPTLPFLKRLKVIELSGNEISDSGAQILANQMSYLVNLSSVNISTNKISYKGILSLANELKDLPSFKTLNFDNNELSSSEVKKIRKIIPEVIN